MILIALFYNNNTCWVCTDHGNFNAVFDFEIDIGHFFMLKYFILF